ncbi:HNH endonuclease [Streptomyces sp. NBC_01506]|uniref:HNH endonuclease n=1 Tax=Streptomyces sp. NBC_01506 TaxID=2903887 RepID=UPI003867BC08
MSSCKACKRAATKARADTNREAVRKEAQSYRQRNRDKIRTAQRAWRALNRERESERSKAWKLQNPDAHARHNSKARAKRYGAEHEPYSRAAVFTRWASRCCYCGSEATALDHVVPLGFGGHDVERNVVPACWPCNSSKGGKSLADWVAAW